MILITSPNLHISRLHLLNYVRHVFLLSVPCDLYFSIYFCRKAYIKMMNIRISSRVIFSTYAFFGGRIADLHATILHKWISQPFDFSPIQKKDPRKGRHQNKCRRLKLTCKGTVRQVFICLRPPRLLGFYLVGVVILLVLNLVRYRVLNSCRLWSPTGPPPFTLNTHRILIHTGKGGGGELNQREG